MANLAPEDAYRLLKERTKEAIESHFPVEGRKHRLELVRIDTEEDASSPSSAHHIYNHTSQTDAKLHDKTWGPDIVGYFRLVDIETGKVIDEGKRTLGQLPKITSRYSYIVEGNERQVDGVFRLNPGAYHVEAANGDLLAKWNVAAGSKVGSFDLIIERKNPKKLGLMHLNVKSSAQSKRKIPVYGILSALGVSDSQMQKAWGQEIYEVNRKAFSPKNLLSFHEAVEKRRVGADKYKAPSVAEARKFIRETFEGAEVNPDTMLSTLGKKFSSINGEALLTSAAKVVGISKGTAEVDDRQSLANKRLFGIEDFVHEEISKGSTRFDMQRKIRNNIDRKDRIAQIIPAASVGYGRLLTSKFKAAQLPTQTNPLQFVSNHTKTTILGQAFGGIKGDNVNLDRDKLINPSHLGLLDPLQTPENTNTGVSLHVPLGARKKGQQLYSRVINVKKGVYEEKNAAELERAVVAYPDQVKVKRLDSGKVKVTPLSQEVVVYDSDRNTAKRPWKDVEYVLPNAKTLFSFSANMVPFVQNNNGNRAMMAAKHQEQAVGLQKREAPLVQSAMKGNLSFDKALGGLSSTAASVSGTVSKITKDAIFVKTEKGKSVPHPIYNHHPLNGTKHMMHSEPTVKVGDKVKRGQLLADSNFTKGGTLSLGTNLRVAYVPYKGYNFEDGIVISESAASKLVSSHLHIEDAQMFSNVVVNKKLWRTYAGLNKATNEVMNRLDDDGVIKEGSEVHPDDVLIARLVKTDMTREAQSVQRSLKKAIRDYKDAAVTWKHEYSGKVVRVVKTAKKIEVHIRTEQTMEAGDKLSGRHGNKGIITKILPDDQMPKDKKGKPVHVLLSPAGVPSRMNVGQILETAASKIARKTGKPYVIENFDPTVDYTQKVKDELKKHKLSDTEELFDPETGESLGQIFTGEQYVLKLDHQAEKKMSARSGGLGYGYRPTGEAVSGSGIGKGGQKVGGLDSYALLAHGARKNLMEMQTYKSDSAQAADVWTRVMEGQRPPPPKVPTSMQHFKKYLRGLGIYAEESGGIYSLSPMTDAQTLAQSKGALTAADKTLVAKGMLTKEEKGGLFDKGKTGGMEGKFWTHIQMDRRMPNPVFEGPIQALLGLKKAEYEKLVSEDGAVGNKSGFQIIEERLRGINVKKELAETETALKTAKKAELNKLYKKARYLRALRDLKIKPVDAYTNQHIPVLPPILRPVKIGYDGTQMIDASNQFYAMIGQMNKQLTNAKKEGLPKADIRKLEAQLYDLLRAHRMNGMTLEGTDLPSLMDKMKGSKPKHSFFQNGVLSKRQDLSGRTVVTPEPTLKMDQVGIPVDMAMETYKPFVIRELWRRMGRAKSPGEARRMIKKNHPAAKQALERVITQRPVIMKRDPALHMFSTLAFKPKLVQGKSIKIHPLVCGGFNADFDGDTMAMFVPVTEEAAEEALEKMLPSKNLFSPTSGGLMLTPSQDSVLGIYQATKWGQKKPGVYEEAEALRLLKNGKLKSYDVISVKGRKKPTTAGRLLINTTLPASVKNDEELLYDPKFRMAKGGMKRFATRVARSDPEEFSAMIDGWKELGFNLSFKNGSSFSLNDFHDGRTIRNNVLKKYKKEEEAIRKSRLSRKKKDEKIIALYQKANEELESVGRAAYKTKNNRMWEWAESGARGNWSQFGQLVMGPMLVQDPSKKFVPVPLTTSFGEGLPVSQYWASLHGARKGTLDRAAGTRDPGALTKELINTVIGVSITDQDCGTTKGAFLAITARDVEGRFLAQDVPLKGGDKLTRGTLLSSVLVKRVQNSGPQKVLVRSPLHCQKANGICATCYGLNERGTLYKKGTNVGVIAGHALGEPVTQMQMRTFHTGGAGSDGLTDYFQQAKDLFKVPEKLRGSATLAEVSGRVEKIETDALGGKKVTIAGKLHTVPHTTQLLPGIRVGAQVKKADALSQGRKNPHDILRITNSMNAVRNHITTELDSLYVNTTGNERRRNIETVIRAMTDVGQITENAPHENLLNGQMASLSELQEKNRQLKVSGQPLIKFKPVLKPMDKVPLSGQEDWMARLNFQRLKDTLIEGGAQNWKSDINGHPIPGIAHGAAFGLDAPKPVVPKAVTPVLNPPNPVRLSPTKKAVQKPKKPAGFFGNIFGE